MVEKQCVGKQPGLWNMNLVSPRMLLVKGQHDFELFYSQDFLFSFSFFVKAEEANPCFSICLKRPTSRICQSRPVAVITAQHKQIKRVNNRALHHMCAALSSSAHVNQSNKVINRIYMGAQT